MLVLRTPRILLRWFTADDAAFIVELLNDPGWKKFIGERGVHNEEDARAWIADRLIASCWDQGFGLWAMQRTEDGELLGMCGLVQRDFLPGIDVGYALLPRFRGMGYVREAVGACLDYSNEVLGVERVLAITRTGNAASVRVLQSLDFSLERTERLADNDYESMLFAWRAPSDEPGADRPSSDARREIDALVSRFYGAFGNTVGHTHHVAALPYYFVPGARIHRVGGDGFASHELRGFIKPRAELLDSGRLMGFSESEIDHRTCIEGRLAQRWSHYRKSGQMDGQPFEGRGSKLMQFIRAPKGWKICDLAWEDHA